MDSAGSAGARLRNFFLLNSARSGEEMRAVLSRYAGPPINLLFATTDGHIGFYALGKIPIRKTGDGTVPYDGAAEDEQWTSYIPFEQMPSSLDPPSATIVTANQRVTDESYQYHLTSAWPDPYRARRISELLKSKSRFSLDDFAAIEADTFSYADEIFTNEVLKFARANAASSADWQRILATLDGWDGKASKDSRALLLAVRMRRVFQQRIMSKIFGNSAEKEFLWPSRNTFIDRVITIRPANWLPEGFDSYEALILACYKDALAEIRQAFGPDEALWTWGNGPQRNFTHPLSGIPYLGAKFVLPSYQRETGGSGDTVNAGAAVSMRFLCAGSNSEGIGVSNDSDWLLLDPRVVEVNYLAWSTLKSAESYRQTVNEDCARQRTCWIAGQMEQIRQGQGLSLPV